MVEKKDSIAEYKGNYLVFLTATDVIVLPRSPVSKQNLYCLQESPFKSLSRLNDKGKIADYAISSYLKWCSET